MKLGSPAKIYSNLKLRYKLIVSFAFICLVSLSLFSIIAVTLCKNVIVEKVTESMLENIQNFKGAFDQYQGGIEEASVRLAYNKEIQDMGSNIDKLQSEKRLQAFLAIDDRIKETFNNTYGIYSLYIMDNYGNMFSNGVSDYQVSTFLSRHDFKKSRWYNDTVKLSGAAYWTIISLDEGQKTIALMRIVNNVETGQQIGFSFITISSGILDRFLLTGTPKSMVFCLVDRNGTIYNESGFKGIEQIVDTTKMADEEGYYEKKTNGKEYRVTYISDPVTKWHYACFIEKSELFSDLSYVNQVWILIFSGSFLLITMISLLISKTISKPLTKLTHLINEVEKGNLNVSFKAQYNDEIGILGNSFSKMVKKVGEGIPLKREKLLRAILESNLDESEFTRMKEAFDIPFNNSFYQVIIINATGGITETTGRLIENEIESAEKSGFNIVSITLKTGQYCLISNHSKEETVNLTQYIITCITQKADIKVRAFVGNNYDKPLFIKNSYEEAKSLMKYQFYNTSVIYMSNDFQDKQSWQVAYPSNIENRLVNYIDEGDIENCRKTINELLEFTKSSSVDPFIIHTLISNIYNYIYKILIKNGILPANIYGNNCWEPYKGINSEGDLDESLQRLVAAIHVFIENMTAAAGTDKIIHPSIRKAIDIIGKEYGNHEVSMEYVAHRVSLHENYFCKLFKKETGVSFMAYLSKIRIEKAKMLLKDPNMKIKDISTTIGFSDPHYFTIWFKENTGLTPSQYKNN